MTHRLLARHVLAAGAAAAALLSVTPSAALADPGTAARHPHHRHHHHCRDASGLRVTGGEIRLRIGRELAQQLTRNDIVVTPVGDARRTPHGFRFPVVAGRLAPRTFAGRAVAVGGLTFAYDGRSVTLRGPVLSTRDGVLRIGKGDRDDQRFSLLLLSYRDADIRRHGDVVTERGLVATLTRDGARVLDEQLHTTVFTAGERVGTLALRVAVTPACDHDGS